MPDPVATRPRSALDPPGQIVILNGPPRSGKSSIATAVQDRFEGVWINLGVDAYNSMIPERFQPGIGLRPGGERPDLEPLVVTLYRGMYEAIAAHNDDDAAFPHRGGLRAGRGSRPPVSAAA